MRKILVTGLLFGALAFAQGQRTAPKDDSMYISEEKLQNILQKVPAAFSTQLITGPGYSTAFIRLEAPDNPHAHGSASEVLIITEGSATMETGGKIVGDVKPGSAVHQSIFTDENGNPRQQAAGGGRGGSGGGRGGGRGGAGASGGGGRGGVAGDIQGSAIEGGHKQVVKPGDIIFIPALVAHTFLEVPDHVVYLDIKFPKGE